MNCNNCGRQINLDEQVSYSYKMCGICQLLALANFVESNEDGEDSLIEISRGEQAGAWLREIAEKLNSSLN